VVIFLGKRPFGRQRRRREDNIEINVWSKGREVDGSGLESHSLAGFVLVC
jgi:hypothetical protein